MLKISKNVKQIFNKICLKGYKKRIKYRKKGRIFIEEAKRAETLADEAVIKANQAEKEAVETAQEAQEIEGQKH